jgi:YegS/Rv2252/BmrU family lipid kinase
MNGNWRGLSQKIYVIVNPASAGGRTRSRWSEISNLLDGHLRGKHSVVFTNAPLEATKLATAAIECGCKLIIAVGGDGTIQEVINGFFDNGKPINGECELGIISSGTGHGFAQSLGLPRLLERQVGVICGGKTKRIDVGKVFFHTEHGHPSCRYFINECQLGIGGAVVKRVSQNHKILGGMLGFGLGTVETVFNHPNQMMTIHSGTREIVKGQFTGIVIGNGEFTGGGMNLVPGARVDDRVLDVLLMEDLSLAQRLRGFAKIYSGKHIDLPSFSCFSTKSMTITSIENVLVEADGELLGTTPCRVEILPSVLPVRCS